MNEELDRIELEMASIPGIPDFWATALSNHPVVNAAITDADIAALRYLVDIRACQLPHREGFSLWFEFSENPFFTNCVLTKKYFLIRPNEQDKYENEMEEAMLERVEGCEICWTSAQVNLCQQQVLKKQRAKKSKAVRHIQTVVDVESFFHFFAPPDLSSVDPESETYETLIGALDMDFQLGFAIFEAIVPQALAWYTGEAVKEEEEEEDEEEEELGEEGGNQENPSECKNQ